MTPFKERAARKDAMYEVIMNDLIKLGIINSPQVKTAKDIIRIIETTEVTPQENVIEQATA